MKINDCQECGGKAAVTRGIGGYINYCTKCFATVGGNFPTITGAKKAWNREQGKRLHDRRRHGYDSK